MTFEQIDIWNREDEAIYGTKTNKINILKREMREQIKERSENAIKERVIKGSPLIKPIMEINPKKINTKPYFIKIRKGWDYEL